jgi:hypothetical protein
LRCIFTVFKVLSHFGQLQVKIPDTARSERALEVDVALLERRLTQGAVLAVDVQKLLTVVKKTVGRANMVNDFSCFHN